MRVVWKRGRQLSIYKTARLEYDGQGRRTKKNSIVYTYDSRGRLIKSSDGLEFIYDVTGLTAVRYGGTVYTYGKDLQGNIVGLLDSQGHLVVEYFYDAWGNHVVRDDSGEVKIGEKNPFRYRGYYYDVETGFYYLQSRYYDPEVGRFITIDNIDYADPETINGLNLYAYCNNNPVMFVDPTGHLFLFCLIAFMITGALLGGLKKGVEAYNNGARGWELAGQVALGVGIGTVVGALTGAGVGAGITLIGTGASAVGGVFALAEGGALSAGLVSVGQLALGGILAVESLKFGGNILFSKKDPIMSNKPPVFLDEH